MWEHLKELAYYRRKRLMEAVDYHQVMIRITMNHITHEFMNLQENVIDDFFSLCFSSSLMQMM